MNTEQMINNEVVEETTDIVEEMPKRRSGLAVVGIVGAVIGVGVLTYKLAIKPALERRRAEKLMDDADEIVNEQID